jgi:hypothetical protein
VEGVREDVRNGRERLIADAVSDLMRMRSEKYVYQYTSLLKSFFLIIVQHYSIQPAH